MNRFAFELSSYTLKTFSGFSKANIKISGERNIPQGSIIFTANHFTRIETIFLPYHIHKLTGNEVWSLAAAELFEVQILKGFLNNLGALSTKDPHRDELILKTLLSKNVHWIIFPEGMMVKNKKFIKNDKFIMVEDKTVKRPHTGAANLAIRCEFYRERMKRLWQMGEPEFKRLVELFEIDNITEVFDQTTFIVPVNITYYPASPKKNILSHLGRIIMKEPSERAVDELMTEGSMLFSDVDIDIRFGEPIHIKPYLKDPYIESILSVKRKVKFEQDISTKKVVKNISFKIMEKYMASVYAMTTLNYDHVFATILKHFPYQRDGIDIEEFRNKAYYAVQWLASKKEFFVSDTFYENQIHLLTDDRYKRISDFLNICEATHIIEIKDNKIFKDQTRFFIQSNFHTIRIENPIMVVANEVEPVGVAEAFLKQTAQKSKDEIKNLVRRKIIEKIEIDYTRDYSSFYNETESKKKRIGQPIFLKQDKNLGGILLVHGYMAAPAEMKRLAQYLFQQGYSVYVPRLKGHGTSPEDLAQTSYEQWIESVEEAYIVLKHYCSDIIVGGFSTGAGLALELCTRVTGIKAVFAVSPPMVLKNKGSHFAPALNVWNVMAKKMKFSKAVKEFLVNRPENPNINYLRNPVAGIAQLEKFMEQLESKLKKIDIPALVIQSRKDPVVSPKGTYKLYELLSSEFKEYYLFDFERHGILNGDDSFRIYNAINNFVSKWV